MILSMKKILAASAFLFAAFAAPLSAYAAFDFQVIDSSHTYVSAQQDLDALVTASQYFMDCNQLAEDVGLDESQEYWCLNRLVLDIPGGGDWGCIILCMVGAGPIWLSPPSYPSGGVGGPSVTGTFIFNARPPGMTVSEYQAYQTGPYYLDEPEELGYQICGTRYDSFPWPYGDCDLYHHEPSSGPVSAWIDANPLSVPSGGQSTLTWGSENATSCTGTNFSTGNATNGTVQVTLSATTTYMVVCTDAVEGEGSGVSGVWQYETTDVSDFACGSGCNRADPNSPGLAYSGMPTCPSSNPSGQSCTYASPGACKWNTWASATSYILNTNIYSCDISGSGEQVQTPQYASDSVTVVVAPATLNASCVADKTTAAVGESVTWTASVTGGTGSYTYSWSGTDSLTGSTASVTKSYSSAGIKYATTTVTSGGQSVTRGCTGPVTVGSNGANLTAGAITPTTGTVNQETTYRSTITNIGSASTETTFNVYFERASNSIGTGASAVGTTALLGPLAGSSATLTASMPITWSSSDADSTVYLRACADRPTSRVLETDESDASNCGPWTPITIEDETICTPSPGCDCSDPDDPDCDSDGGLSCDFDDANSDGTIDVNENVTFSASPSNLGNGHYTWNPSVGSTVVGNATYTRSFNVEGDFEMEVTAPGDDYDNPGTCEFTVGEEGCTAANVSLTASPDRVKKGTKTDLVWDIPSTTDSQCRITSSADSSFSIPIDINECTPEGTDTGETHDIMSQTTFTLTCDNKTDTVVVNVFPEIDEF